MSDAHQPVLLHEVLLGMAIQPEGRYVDATFGRGGHSRAILQQLGEGGRLLVIDKDPAAIAALNELNDKRIVKKHGTFANLFRYISEAQWLGQVDGILFDFGVSSPQLDTPERGFSFMRQGPLDMRMDTSQGQTAADWLNGATEQSIAQVIWRYGEERHARRIASAIVTARQATPLVTTQDLVAVITQVVPRSKATMHPATKSFQAIRIFINNELQDIEQALPAAYESLKVGGRLCVISFHSLEDRLVKRFIKRLSDGENLAKVPLTEAQRQRQLRKVGKLIKATDAQIKENPRARSARLRIAEKLL